MVRDPRDIAVSAYHYHLWTTEKWVHVPGKGFGGKTYQELLRSLDAHEGLSAEIRRLAGSVFTRMAEWNYDQPGFIELRYEDVIADEDGWFTRTFRHYGFNDKAISDALSIVRSHSFTKVAGRAVGETENEKHLRSGRAGQWRDEFTSDHIALFKKCTGDLVVRLGYEQDDDW